MENNIENIIDLAIYKFCEKISTVFKANKWNLFVVHKFGEIIEDNIEGEDINDLKIGSFISIKKWKVNYLE